MKSSSLSTIRVYTHTLPARQWCRPDPRTAAPPRPTGCAEALFRSWTARRTLLALMQEVQTLRRTGVRPSRIRSARCSNAKRPRKVGWDEGHESTDVARYGRQRAAKRRGRTAVSPPSLTATRARNGHTRPLTAGPDRTRSDTQHGP